ncbi:MAG: hypothetical protein ER33_06590 [Cyanobium sp. CACIAM 14]|nr:MAG: hypothetical protein ER33_06590 [Cyanobium sp. CACIAM 14]
MAAFLALVLAGAGLLALTASPVSALPLPGRWNAPTGGDGRLETRRSGLQEVAPPLAVQQMQDALDGRRPRVEILSPADGALLPAGPWSLRLRVEDWPLVNAGPLGLGPHLVVQLDGDPPLALTTTATTMRALEPGSHRLTVYAARPWGEAVKSPGAQRQIRLHRVAANPLSQPAPSSPQLIAVSPRGRAAASPLLLDWLLIDAPLQNLRAGDASWRLRVSVNGDSFLVDHQTPLWLEGWRAGSNAIQLELLDAIGEPLNPPFNSLVGEVTLEPGGEGPRWQGGRLDPIELATLLGEEPPPVEPSAAPEPDETAEAGSETQPAAGGPAAAATESPLGEAVEEAAEPTATAAPGPLSEEEAPGVAETPLVDESTAVDRAPSDAEAAVGAVAEAPSNVKIPAGVVPEAAITSQGAAAPETATEEEPLRPPTLKEAPAITDMPDSVAASPTTSPGKPPPDSAPTAAVRQRPPAVAKGADPPGRGEGWPDLLERVRRRLAQ